MSKKPYVIKKTEWYKTGKLITWAKIFKKNINEKIAFPFFQEDNETRD